MDLSRVTNEELLAEVVGRRKSAENVAVSVLEIIPKMKRPRFLVNTSLCVAASICTTLFILLVSNKPGTPDGLFSMIVLTFLTLLSVFAALFVCLFVEQRRTNVFVQSFTERFPDAAFWVYGKGRT